MIRTLMVYLQNVPTTGQFDNTIIANILGIEIGYALAKDNRSIQDYYLDDYKKVLHGNPVPVKTSTAFHERFCITSDLLLTDQVKLVSGDIVNISDYELILISHVWFYNYYIQYLRNMYPKLKIIGIQEEGLQDVTFFSSGLQMLHLKTLAIFDGYITINRQYENWISKTVHKILHLPLPIPKSQFSNENMSKKRHESICIGIGTWNLDCSNFYTNLHVLKILRDKGYDLEGEIIGIKPWQRNQIDGYLDGMKYIKVFEDLGVSLYNHLSKFRFAVILTTRATSGRISAEFAALGVPCIGNKHNELQRKCWPDLSIDPFDVPAAVSMAIKLIQDDKYYETIVGKASEQIKELNNHNQTHDKLIEFISEIVSFSNI